MNIFATQANLLELTHELAKIPLHRIADGSGSSHFDGPEQWIHGLSMNRFSPSSYPKTNALIAGLRTHVHLGLVEQAMINRLSPYGELSPHRDGLPEYDRYHFPIIADPGAYWWDEINGTMHMQEGCWYGPVPYCGVLHSAGNPTPIQRVHLIVDFAKVTP